MEYMSPEHKQSLRLFDSMWKTLDGLDDLAKQYDINDITMDCNLKLLQTLITFNLTKLPGREGSDAEDEYGNKWELKTVNLRLTKSFSTNHHTTHDIINAFRSERWLFSVYDGITLIEAYALTADKLEPYFTRWEEKLNTGVSHINNPKIPLKFVQANGVKVYPISDPPINPADI